MFSDEKIKSLPNSEQLSLEQMQQKVLELKNEIEMVEKQTEEAEQKAEELRQMTKRAEQKAEEARQRVKEAEQKAEEARQREHPQLGGNSSSLYSSFYKKFAGSETIEHFPWLKKESPYTAAVAIDTAQVRKEEDVQHCCNMIFEKCSSDLRFIDTHTTPYLLTTGKPDLSFVSATKVEYDKSVLSDFVIVIGEVKDPSENIQSESSLGLIYYYLQVLLRSSRTHVYGFISNFRETIFIKLSDDFIVQRTPVYSDVFEVGPSHVLVHYIPQFFRKAKEEMHFVLPETFSNYKIVGRIGEGITSNVYELMHDETSSVLKVRKQADMDDSIITNEVTILDQLKDPCFANFIPEVSNTGANFIHFAKKYVKLKPEHLTKTNVSAFIQSLQKMHLLTIFHRDIKPDNLMFDPVNESIVLLDFGYAISGKEVAPFAGTLTFAAEEFLSYYEMYFFQYETDYFPRYDLESFLKCVYFIRNSPSDIIMLDEDNPTTVKEFVTKLTKINRTWKALLAHNKLFIHLLQKVKENSFSLDDDVPTLINC